MCFCQVEAQLAASVDGEIFVPTSTDQFAALFQQDRPGTAFAVFCALEKRINDLLGFFDLCEGLIKEPIRHIRIRVVPENGKPVIPHQSP